jgi:hypothetical protein
MEDVKKKKFFLKLENLLNKLLLYQMKIYIL